MAARRGVKIKDRGFSKLARGLKTMQRMRLRLGVFASAGKHRKAKGLTVADIAMIHELGLGSVPKRSWLLAWIRENKEEMNKRLKKAYETSIKNRTDPELALRKVGEWAVSEIKKRIKRGIPPKLSDATIKRKKSSKILIDTSQFIGAISYKVEKK